jgi:hypothetical protein
MIILFRLTNIPISFMRIMNNVLREYLDKIYIYYLDNILIYLGSEEEYMRHVKDILETLWKARLFYKPEKCEFYIKEVEFLGYIITLGYLGIDPKKVTAVKE